MLLVQNQTSLRKPVHERPLLDVLFMLDYTRQYKVDVSVSASHNVNFLGASATNYNTFFYHKFLNYAHMDIAIPIAMSVHA